MHYVKDLVKKSRLLAQIYYIVALLPSIPLSDFKDRKKIRLLFTVKPYSGLSYPRLAKIYELVKRIEYEQLEGTCVECGVWNGGSAGIVADRIRQNPLRHLWLFDSWEGLPDPLDIDRAPDGTLGEKGTSFGYQDKVEELLFQKLQTDPSRIHLVKGWFQDTFPEHIRKIGNIALLHLDCDWYESIKFCLEQLYDRVVDGGFIVIDDYGYWQGCKKAVDEFFEMRRIPETLQRIDDIGVYLRKGDTT
jgi:hypothetical protein